MGASSNGQGLEELYSLSGCGRNTNLYAKQINNDYNNSCVWRVRAQAGTVVVVGGEGGGGGGGVGADGGEGCPSCLPAGT